MKNENPTGLLDRILDTKLYDVHTMLPAKIIDYDADTETATVQPLIKQLRKVAGDQIIEIPLQPIANVPVLKFSSESFIIKFPIKKNCGCALFFAESSIGNWKNSDGVEPVAVEDTTKFSLTDAFCIPGLFPPSSVPSATPTIELSDDLSLSFLGGTDNAVGFEKLKKGYDDLKQTVNDLVSAFMTHSHASAAPGPPVPPTVIPPATMPTPNTSSIDAAKKEKIKL